MDDLKQIIRAIAISYDKKGLTLSELAKMFKKYEGYTIPFKEYGFSGLVAMLRNMPDSVQLQGHGMNTLVLPVVTDASRHVRNMVVAQKNFDTSTRTQKTWNAPRQDSRSSRASVDVLASPEMNIGCISKDASQTNNEPVDLRQAESMPINCSTIPLSAITLPDRLPKHKLPSSVKPKGVFPVWVGSVVSPKQIYVKFECQLFQRLEVDSALEAWYSSFDSDSAWRMQAEAIKADLFCVVKLQCGWRRGIIQGPLIEHRVEVFLIDCGNTISVASSDIWYMRMKESFLPPLSTLVSMAHVKPTECEWTEEAIQFLTEAMRTNLLEVHMAGLNIEDSIPEVIFMIRSNPEGISLNEQLVLKKYAKWAYED